MKIAVITGASSGIGREFVYAVDQKLQLDEIWVIARRAERLEELREKCTTPLRALALDLSAREGIEAYRAALEEEKPQIALLVNAAGCGVFGPFAEQDLDALLHSASLNALTLTAMCHISLPYIKRGVYGASKSYVLSLSRAIGRELRPRGVHVMCVCPGWIKTEFQEHAHHDDYIRYVDRWYGPEEVAAQAMADLEKKKTVSILGAPVRRQVALVKHLPVDTVMDIWCKQQGFE